MKKILLLAFGLQMVFAMYANAQNETGNDTVIVIKQPNEVRIEEAPNSISVEVKGREGESEFYYARKLEVTPNSSVISVEKTKEWDFKIPFGKGGKSKKKYSNNIVMGGLGFGFVNAVDAPDGMDVDMGASYEFMIEHLLAWEYSPWRSGSSFSIGFGLDWRNYRMTGRTRFIKENDNLVLGGYPEGADIKFSRLKVFSLTVPLMFRQVICDRISFSLGPVINFNTHASLKTRYTLDGGKHKLTDDNIHQTPVTVDFMGRLCFRSIGFYVKYSPSNVLKTDFGPKFSSMSAGITLFY